MLRQRRWCSELRSPRRREQWCGPLRSELLLCSAAEHRDRHTELHAFSASFRNHRGGGRATDGESGGAETLPPLSASPSPATVLHPLFCLRKRRTEEEEERPPSPRVSRERERVLFLPDSAPFFSRERAACPCLSTQKNLPPQKGNIIIIIICPPFHVFCLSLCLSVVCVWA